VRFLIGDAHWLSDGHHKEALVREFLRRYLPQGLSVSTGFVRSPAGQHSCSPEVDVLIADPEGHPPLFAEAGLQIVAPTSVVAHMEIKTTFRRDTLTAAFKSIAETQLAISQYADHKKIWRSVCFFDASRSREPDSFLVTIRETVRDLQSFVKEQLKSDIASNGPGLMSLLPNCVVTLSPYIAFVSCNSDSSITLRLFQLEGLSPACMFADLFSTVRRRFGRPTVGELDDMVEHLDIPMPLTMDVKC
jgi:hypothetical protein